ncbi:MAG: glucose-1-phosphate cytidylyltransferase [Deltaproteobacteria bacterium]|nr:glucose-1-phosphate cytidylyltransferase [Deltaproteobacteria bacterium]
MSEPLAMILCGGRGTRLREETEFRPKPMVEIGGRPIVWHIMKHYATYGVRRFVLCLGYKGSMIKDWFLRYEERSRDVTVTLGKSRAVLLHDSDGHAHDEDGWEITLADTGEDAMTGARVAKAAKRHAAGQRFFLTYGDGVSDVNLHALRAQHERSGATVTVTGVRPPARFGELICTGDRVREFSEKPQTQESRINGGFFMCEPEILSYVHERDDCTLEREPLEALAKANALGIHRHDGFWQCMDTLRDHQYLESLWRQGSAPWKTW